MKTYAQAFKKAPSVVVIDTGVHDFSRYDEELKTLVMDFDKGHCYIIDLKVYEDKQA